MTYYQVEFQTGSAQGVEAKLFRTEEKAKKHAMKVLGISDESSLEPQVTIHPIPRTRAGIQ